MDESSESDSDKVCAKSTLQSKEKFQIFLQRLGLTNKYPQRLSLRDAMTIRQETLGTVNTTNQLTVLPYLVLQKLMMCDQRCRSCLFQLTKVKQNKVARDDSDSDSDDDDDDTRLHPVDCMLAILHCCDNILRQDMISKLLFCQLAIPLLLPNPIDDSMMFLLWALRSLIKGWKCHKTGEQENRIVDHKGPIVSFLRIGTSKLSKSEILNAVISDESKAFFFRRGCQGGDCKRNFVEGLVEMSCYFPAGKDKDSDAFPVAITFVNLRGDAQQYKKQVNFLQQISFMSVVLVTEATIDTSNIEILENLAKSPGGIILLLAEGKAKNKISKESLRKSLQSIPKDKYTKIRLKSKSSMDTIKTYIQNNIREKINSNETIQFRSISDCYSYAQEIGIEIDESNEDCTAGKTYAEMVMKNVHLIKFNEVKDKMLPLQGPELWCKWAKHDKERYRHVYRKQANVQEYNAQIDRQKSDVRNLQLKKCKTLTPLMDCFMTNLLQTNGKTRTYFLQWLKLLLDDHSRRILPELNNN